METRLIKPKTFLKDPISILIGCSACLIFASTLIIPITGGTIFASPDETAVVVIAKRLGAFSSPAIAELLVASYPWLHPRSWVSQGTVIVPVGFLGWPFFLAPIAWIGADIFFPWIGWLLAFSSLFPLFGLLSERYEKRHAAIGVIVTAAMPMFIFYANRGLFPNVGVLAAVLWSLWAIRRSVIFGKQWWIVGFFCGALSIIRPIELLWVLPWWVWALHGLTRKRWGELFGALPVFGLILGAFGLLNHITYGAPWHIGYWMSDNTLLNIKSTLLKTSSSQLFPFGIHPRNILWNVSSFFRAFLWPYLCIVLLAMSHKLYRERGFKKTTFYALSGWTCFIFLLIYGSGLYQDHVRLGAVTIGNSFLRYLLPLIPLVAVACTDFVAYLPETRWSKMISGSLLFSCVVFGVYSATIRDDEGVWKTRKELMRYEVVRRGATEAFVSGSIILSERSDKIFAFRERMRSVSPLPPLSEIARLVREEGKKETVGLYARPLSQKERDRWHANGLELTEVALFERENLYQIISK